MNSDERWQRIWEVFEQALERPEADIPVWLAAECGDDAELRREVESLLTAHGAAGGILENTVSLFRLESLAKIDEPASANETVGPYRVLEEIGRGGMAVVYKAEDPRLGRFVALKFLSPNLTSGYQGKQRMISEARAASRLDHPNICTIYDIGETPDGRLYLAMAYYEGRTLADRLLGGPLPAEEALAITAQIARAIGHAHEAGVIHRDIKPSNVLLTSRGEVKVLDFGLAKQGALSITEPGIRLGTVYYASPEQARGKEVDARTDLWSLGATLYEMLTGRPPFPGEDPVAVLYKIVHEDPPPLGPGVPARVARIVRKLLAKNPGARYASAGDLLRDLGVSVSSVSDPQWSRTAGAGGWSWKTVVAALAVPVLVASGALLFLRHPLGRPAPPAPPAPPVPLTSFPGREELASFSPDGSQAAFSWNGPNLDNFDIYVKMIDSPAPLRLTRHEAWESSPAWSPAGNEIAFLRERSDGGVEVLLTTPIGGSERLLASAVCSVRSGLSWSPDGRRILVADRASPHGPPEVAVIDATTGEKQTLAPAPANSVEVRSPVFSPDGRSVAFDVLHGAGLGDTYLLADGEVRRLTSMGGEPEGLAWTSDGDQILCARISSEGRRAMWRVPAAGGVPSPLELGDNPSQPALWPAGSRLAFSKRSTSYGIVRIDARGRLNPPPVSPFIASTRFDATPHYSPDGSRIAFASSRSGGVQIWICDADGTNLRQLTSLGTAGSPRWSPDGSQLAFDSIVEGNADVYVVSARGGPPRRVTTNEAEDVVPSWSGDGRWIYFASLRSGRLQVWKIPSDAGGEAAVNPVQVTTDGGFHANESRDGTVLYYSKSRSPDNAIWRMPVAGGPEELLIDSVSSGWGNWEIARDGIYFVDNRGPAGQFVDTKWSVCFYRFRDRSVSEVVPLIHVPTRGGEGLGVSPDGRWILLGHVVNESDLMLVERFR